MSIDKNISKVLDIDPVDVVDITVVTTNTAVSTAQTSPTTKEVKYEDQEDFELARETMKELLHKSLVKLDEFGSLASDLETARAFEVYATMVEKTSALAQNIYDMHQRKKDLRDEDVPSSGVNIERAVFVGNQTEMLEALQKKNGNGQK